MNVRVSGLERFTAQLTGLGRRLEETLGEALKEDLEDTALPLSQELVPVLTHDLQNTAYVDGPFIVQGGVGVTFGYGDTDVDYALLQHENLDFAHPNGGQAKFAEVALLAWTADGPARVAQRAVRALS
jgi:hypothetical protein